MCFRIRKRSPIVPQTPPPSPVPKVTYPHKNKVYPVPQANDPTLSIKVDFVMQKVQTE